MKSMPLRKERMTTAPCSDATHTLVTSAHEKDDRSMEKEAVRWESEETEVILR